MSKMLIDEATVKLALEAFEYIEHNYMSLPAPAEKAVTALKALAEQPAQQEPVAWRGGPLTGDTEMTLPVVCFDGNPSPNNEPLYTAPPASKPWVGLTQKDIDIAFDDTQEGGGFDDFARAIEAKLKEKNT